MSSWFLSMAASVGTLILTLLVTAIFNRMSRLPKEFKEQKETERAKEERFVEENVMRDAKIASLEKAVNALPGYRAQSIQIQEQLKSADKEILDTCIEIKNSVASNQRLLDERLRRLEKCEKNAIRAKLIEEYRLFTDPDKNPMLAWSEMEHHAFFSQVEDYEELNGNGYMHDTVIPEMHKLTVIPMSDKVELLKLMSGRKLS